MGNNMSEIMKIPSIRFEEFTDNWKKFKLSHLYEFSKGKGLSLDSFYEGIDSLSIAYGHLYTKYSEVINKVLMSSNDENGVISQKGDLLFPGSSTVPFGTAQSNAIMLDNVKLGGDVIIARPKQFYTYAPFISYQINAKREKLFPITVGTTITHMYGKDISNIEYYFPGIDEQKRIGKIFENLDQLISLHQCKYEKLQQVKKSLLEKMFPKEGEVVPRIRFKGFTDGWEQYKLGDLGFFKSNGVDKLSKPNEIPVNLLNYMDVYKRLKVSNKNTHQLMQVTAKPSQLIENSVTKNDVFFTPTSETPKDIGRVYVIEETLNNTVYSYHLMRFRPNQGTYYPNFPNYSLMAENVRKQFFLAAKGVQRYVISKADFESIVDTIPEYKEQTEIGEFFRSIDQLITINNKKYEKLKNIKKALLQKMFV